MKLKISVLLVAFSVFFASSAFSADIKIGIAGPFTGAYAAFGEQLKRGAQKAALSCFTKLPLLRIKPPK